MCPDAEIRGSQTWKISISWGTSVQLLLWENSEGNGFWFFNFQLTGITDGKREMLWLDSDLSPSLVSGCGVGAVKTSQVVGCQWTSCPCSRAVSVKCQVLTSWCWICSWSNSIHSDFLISERALTSFVTSHHLSNCICLQSSLIKMSKVFFLYFDTKRAITPGFHTCFFFFQKLDTPQLVLVSAVQVRAKGNGVHSQIRQVYDHSGL